MRTDDLICMMAKAPPCSCTKRNAVIWGGIAVMFAVMVGVVALTLGLRDFDGLMDDRLMLFKYAFLGAAVTGTGIAWWQSGHPGCTWRIARVGLWFMAAGLLVMAAWEVATTPMPALKAAVFDRAAWSCVGFIALYTGLGAMALCALTGCMAPIKGRQHAVLTALFAAALGALAYGLHCRHDNAAYLALWYGGTAAIAVFVLVPFLRKKQAW